jgi:heme o synthase
MKNFKHYIALTKPTVLTLVLLTGAAALTVNGGFNDDPIKFITVILGLFLVGGSANAFNQYFERNVDSQMTRTKMKRPLANGSLKADQAFYFAVISGIVGISLFTLVFNALSGLLSLFTIIFYSFFYTLFLKPRTPQNIVIGGAAGAMGPVIAWAAVTGTIMSVVPWTIFFLIFFWTPPHFWALALYLKEDYKKVNYPMMPNVRGDEATVRLMLVYALIMVIVSFGLVLYDPVNKPLDIIYTASSAILGSLFIKKVVVLLKNNNIKEQKALFAYSIIYIFALCFIIMIDAVY